MNSLQTFDEIVFSWFNASFTNPLLDISMPLITVLGNTWLAWTLLFLICLIIPAALFSPKTTDSTIRKPIISHIMTSFRLFILLTLICGVNSGLYSNIKRITDRARPFEQKKVELRVSNEEARQLSHNGSFPSGHAANAFMLAVLLSVARKKLWFIFYFVAAIVAFSRIYLGLHYPSDVLAGALIGWGSTKILISSQWIRTKFTF